MTEIGDCLKFSIKSAPVRSDAPQGPSMSEETPDSLEAARLEKLRRIEALGIDPWGQRFDDHKAVDLVRAIPLPEQAEGAEEPPRPTVRIAGRIVLRRGQGKVSFLQVRDWTGTIQVMIGKNQVGEAGWALTSELDLGDLIGVDGGLGLTRTGELTVFATGLTFLGKSLLPPPEKWHGLTDTEKRSRQRYVDLAHNPRAWRRSSGGRRWSRRSGRSWRVVGSSRSRPRPCSRSRGGRRPGRS